MAPRAKQPPCPECGNEAFEELQQDGEVHRVERHALKCGRLPLVPFNPDAETVVVRYNRRHHLHLCTKL